MTRGTRNTVVCQALIVVHGGHLQQCCARPGKHFLLQEYSEYYFQHPHNLPHTHTMPKRSQHAAEVSASMVRGLWLGRAGNGCLGPLPLQLPCLRPGPGGADVQHHRVLEAALRGTARRALAHAGPGGRLDPASSLGCHKHIPVHTPALPDTVCLGIPSPLCIPRRPTPGVATSRCSQAPATPQDSSCPPQPG